MSGTLDLIQRSYLGEAVRDGVLCFDPKAIDKLEGLSLPMRFRGTLLELTLEGGNLRVAAQADSFKRSVRIRVGDSVRELKAGESQTFAL
jgi:trehalose/maltose hydrolase-like predicted phosphorylase